MEKVCKYAFSVISGVIVDLLGGWDVWLATLVAFMIVDVVIGLFDALLLRSRKSESGGLSARSMFEGGKRKVQIILLVALGTMLDKIIYPESMYIRCSVVAFYIVNEGVSILENIASSGLPLPNILYSALDIIKKEKDSKK